MSEQPVEARCRNCGRGLAPASRFCSSCGQATAVHPPTVIEFAHEFIGHYVALEGPLWRTLGALLLSPGKLSLEYFAGRRARYVLPLRLYLSFSLLLFATISVGGGELKLGGEAFRLTAAMPVPNAEDGTTGPAAGTSAASAPAQTTDTRFERMQRRIKAMTPVERSQRMQSGLRKYLPYAVMLLVPVLAFYKMLLYRRCGLRYGEHLVVAFHAQTVVLAFALLSMLPWPGWFGTALMALLAAHGLVGLKRVYGGGPFTTVLKAGLLITVYGATIVVAVVLLMILSVIV